MSTSSGTRGETFAKESDKHCESRNEASCNQSNRNNSSSFKDEDEELENIAHSLFIAFVLAAIYKVVIYIYTAIIPPDFLRPSV